MACSHCRLKLPGTGTMPSSYRCFPAVNPVLRNLPAHRCDRFSVQLLHTDQCAGEAGEHLIGHQSAGIIPETSGRWNENGWCWKALFVQGPASRYNPRLRNSTVRYIRGWVSSSRHSTIPWRNGSFPPPPCIRPLHPGNAALRCCCSSLHTTRLYFFCAAIDPALFKWNSRTGFSAYTLLYRHGRHLSWWGNASDRSTDDDCIYFLQCPGRARWSLKRTLDASIFSLAVSRPSAGPVHYYLYRRAQRGLRPDLEDRKAHPSSPCHWYHGANIQLIREQSCF